MLVSIKISVVCVLFVVTFIIGGVVFPTLPQFYLPFLLIFVSVLIFQCIQSIFELLSSITLKRMYSLFIAGLVAGISIYAWYAEFDRIYYADGIWDEAWNLWGLGSIRGYDTFLRATSFLTLILFVINCVVLIRNKEQRYLAKWDKSKASILLLTMLMLTLIYPIAAYCLISGERNEISVTIVKTRDTAMGVSKFQVTKPISLESFLLCGTSLFLGWILTIILLGRTNKATNN